MNDASERLYPVLTKEQFARWAEEVKLHMKPNTLTLADYLDEARFPLTTRKGLTVEEQLTIDAFDLAALEQEEWGNPPLSEAQSARLEELREKAKYRAELLRELGLPMQAEPSETVKRGRGKSRTPMDSEAVQKTKRGGI